MSALEEQFLFQVRALGLPEPTREYCAIPGRRFRWDFAWVERKVLVEINGGIYKRMGHSTGDGIARDYEKHNLATLAGWKVLVFDTQSVMSGKAVDMVIQILEQEDK